MRLGSNELRLSNERKAPGSERLSFSRCVPHGYFDAAASCLIAADIMRTRAVSLAPLA